MDDANHTQGVYAAMDDLVRLRHRSRGFSFLPKQPVQSLLAGRHASRLRGRGLNFEEIRKYLPGDDIRQIDWKVTARTRKPHARVYTEERERPVILLVDRMRVAPKLERLKVLKKPLLGRLLIETVQGALTEDAAEPST